MLRTRAEQVSFWEAVLPAEVLRLPAELAGVDALLDDPVFFTPVRGVLRSAGGPAVDPDGDLSAVDVSEVPVPVGLGDPVPGGVGLDHLAAVCPIPLDGRVPRPTTLMKLTTRCGTAGCDEALLAKAAQAKLLPTTRVRADTPVIPADVAYPAGSRAHGIAAKLRLRTAQGRDDVQATVARITGELAGLAERAATDADRLLGNAHRAGRRFAPTR